MQKEIKTGSIMLGLLIGGFIGLFSETALNIALTTFMKELSISASTVQWLTTGYLLVVGVLVPISGLLIRWFTTRQLLITALCAFIIGTFISAISHGFILLLIGRLIQGIATGILIPLIFNTIIALYPPHRRGAALGLVGLVIMFAPAVGPTVAGFILGSLTWQWIFWLMLPFLVIALIIAIIFCRNVNEVTRPKMDVLSILLSTVGFGGIVLGFSSSGDKGWISPNVIISLLIGVFSLLLFVLRQLKMDKPMLNLKALKFPMFTLGTFMIMITFGLIMSTVLLLPMYFQTGKLIAVAIVGLLLLPGGILNGIMSVVAGKLYDSYGPKWLIRIGFILSIVSTIMLINIQTTSAIPFVVIANIILFIGIPLILAPSQTNGLNALPRELAPDGSAIMNTAQQISGAISTALSTALLAAGQKSYVLAGGHNLAGALTNGVRTGFIFTLILAIIGLILSFFVKRSNLYNKGMQGKQ